MVYEFECLKRCALHLCCLPLTTGIGIFFLGDSVINYVGGAMRKMSTDSDSYGMVGSYMIPGPLNAQTNGGLKGATEYFARNKDLSEKYHTIVLQGQTPHVCVWRSALRIPTYQHLSCCQQCHARSLYRRQLCCLNLEQNQVGAMVTSVSLSKWTPLSVRCGALASGRWFAARLGRQRWALHGPDDISRSSRAQFMFQQHYGVFASCAC